MGRNKNHHSGLDYVHLLISRSHMESGLHGVRVVGGSGILVGTAEGVGQLGSSGCFTGQ